MARAAQCDCNSCVRVRLVVKTRMNTPPAPPERDRLLPSSWTARAVQWMGSRAPQRFPVRPAAPSAARRRDFQELGQRNRGRHPSTCAWSSHPHAHLHAHQGRLYLSLHQRLASIVVVSDPVTTAIDKAHSEVCVRLHMPSHERLAKRLCSRSHGRVDTTFPVAALPLVHSGGPRGCTNWPARGPWKCSARHGERQHAPVERLKHSFNVLSVVSPPPI